MTTQLSLYNGALRLCMERKLASLTEAREPRRYLDDAWEDGAVDACLEMGLWSFAIRTVQLTYDSGITPSFGASRVFAVPDDFLKLNELSTDEMFTSAFNAFRMEAGKIYAEVDTLYLSYVSNDPSFGGDMTRWPNAFEGLVQAYLAAEIVGRLTTDRELKKDVEKKMAAAQRAALAVDALNKPARRTPRGTWVAARIGGGGMTSNPQTRLY